MEADNKHRWTQDDSYKDSSGTFKRRFLCNRCGCEKLSDYYGYSSYIRSGQIFSDRPDCIDWAKENQKTID